MIQAPRATLLKDVGEKALIANFLRPLFNPNNDPNGVGDDCAAALIPPGALALFSTDRVPADLLAFRARILDYYGLGRYLAVLNVSDIAACGGKPLGLLLNFGLPGDLELEHLSAICRGALAVVESVDARIFGGDLSASPELSLSATAIGFVDEQRVLRRSGAKIGDSIFFSRSPGLTPVALQYCLSPGEFEGFEQEVLDTLKNQFTVLTPMVALGARLSESGQCSSAMDNTDGLCQTLSELAAESDVSMVIDSDVLDIPEPVVRYADRVGADPVRFAFGPGADFSLVGTLKGSWTTARAAQVFGPSIRIVGSCERAQGFRVFVQHNRNRSPLHDLGWNYFSQNPT